jgi:thiol-disulfide isomerase/thioredoxin
MNSIKKYLPWTLRIIIAVLFLLSAVAKLYPSPLTALGTFEAKQLIPLGFSDGLAPYFSRFLIAAEFAIGIAILQPHFLKRFVIPVAIILLLVFCGQLSYDIISKGADAGNCGCFGTLIPMTPLEALIKNIIAIGLLVYLYRLLSKDKLKQRFGNLMIIFLSFALLLFAMAPIQFGANQTTIVSDDASLSDFTDSDLVPGLDLKPDSVLLQPKTKITAPDVAGKEDKTTDKVVEPEKPAGPSKVVSKFSPYLSAIPAEVKIDEGKKILCLFAPGCEHCQETAKILTEMRSQIKDFPPIHIVFMDEEPEAIPNFFKIAGRTYSYRIAPVVDFWKILDYSRDTPGVVYMWNGNIRYFSDGINEKAFDKEKFKKELLKEK